jgi:hypothetical protein
MYNGVNWEDNGEEKRNQWGGKTKVNEADLPFNIYHVDLRFFQINLNVKQREIYIYIFDLVNYSEL